MKKLDSITADYGTFLS